MSKKRSRLRFVGRWGVWVCTGFVLIGLALSIWTSIGFKVTRVFKGQKFYYQTVMSAGFDHGRLKMEYIPKLGFSFHDPSPREPGWKYGFQAPYQIWMNGDPRWWGPPHFGQVLRISYQLEMPLAYLGAFTVLWSWWLVRGAKRRRGLIGCCEHCGYSLEGLDGGVCPECGDGVDLV